MTITAPGRFAMLRRTLLEVPPGRDLRVACGGGSLWLTLDNDRRDIVLERGDSIELAGDRRALVYALEDAVLELEAVRQPAPARVAGPRPSRPLLQARFA